MRAARDPALALFVREWRIARRIGGGASVGAVFFLILVAIMPFALGPDLELLARLGPAILWIAALLATLLGLDRLFQADQEDGSLDLMSDRLAAARTRRAGQMRGALDRERPAAGGVEPAVRPDAGDGAAAARARRGDARRRHAGPDHDRRDRRGADGVAPARRPPDGGAGAAARRFPVLIFGVSAASAASGGAAPFLTPFLMLCAMSLFAIAAAPFAAAAALRHVRE